PRGGHHAAVRAHARLRRRRDCQAGLVHRRQGIQTARLQETKGIQHVSRSLPKGGKIVIKKDYECIGCEACSNSCPNGAIKITEE
ncbi:MAG: 4Fe-4S binding protein, partial [Candidatus Lokiarchaeota archaeon]|nr:4Fe-4S binding protein [Candidatus Lokiarchaeota archaeon]